MFVKVRKMELSAEIIKEMGAIVDDNNAMTKLLKYVRRLSRKVNSENPGSEDITSKIANGLKEVKMAQEGAVKLNTLDHLINELEDRNGF